MEGEIMKLQPGEKEAIKQVIELGKKYGFGNLIAWLKHEWAKTLSERYHQPFRDMLPACDVDAYPESFSVDDL